MKKVCEDCGKHNDRSKHFCVDCGRLLPELPRENAKYANPFAEIFGNNNQSDKTESQPERNPDAGKQDRQPSQNTSTEKGGFETVFASLFGRPATNLTEKTSGKPVSEKQQSSDAGSSAPQKKLGKTDALKLVAAAATKAMFKSLSLSAAVLGPGFLLLLSGQQIPGMVWLFFGSFGLMAWTYRKPWRLGWISCLIPPVVAGFCYLVQLAIFQQTPPLTWILAAAGAGAAIGFYRGLAHEIYEEDKSVFAQRTIQYLLAWVAAYAATQVIAMTSANVLAIRGGLVTGALTTTMLAVVSVMLIQKWRLTIRVATMAAIGVALMPLLQISTVRADGDDVRALNRYFTGQFYEIAQKGFDREMPCQPVHSTSMDSAYDLSVDAWVVLACGAWKSGDFAERKGVQIRIGLDLEGSSFLGTSPELLENKSSRIGSDYDFVQQNVSTNAYLGYATSIVQTGKDVKTKEIYVTKRESKTRFESRQFYSVPSKREWLKRLVEIEVEVRLYDRDYENHSGMQVDPVPIALSLSNQAYEVVVNTLGKPQGSAQLDPPQPKDDSAIVPGSNDSSAISPDEAAAAAAAVAAALIAAGIAVNIAQAVAAAVAQALQSGVQLTAEEIQAAIMEALTPSNREGGQNSSGSTGRDQPRNSARGEDGSPFGLPGTSTGTNAPPNVQMTERVRPPTPVLDENGQPFKTNEDGQYLAPNEKGDLEWMSRQDAEEAATALREEQARKERERARVEREARRDREQWWDKKEDESQQAERERQRREAEDREREAAEERRRDNLETVIMSTLEGDSSRSDYSDLVSRLATASQEGDTGELENIWYELLGDRQRQLDQMAQERQQRQDEAETARRREDMLVFVRDRGKNAAQAALGLASGGGLSIAQVGILAASNTGIHAIETGLTAKGDGVHFDGWEATRGGMRGLANTANSVVGGISANGNAAVMAGKTVFSATNTYGQTFADTHNKTGDRDLAHSRAGLAAAADAGKSVAGELFDEHNRRQGMAAQSQALETPSNINDVADPSWVTQHTNSLRQSGKIRTDAAKTAANVLGNTLGNIATAENDRDAETDVAVWNAVKTEGEGQFWSRVASAGAQESKPTPEQQSVIDRLQNERMGTAPRPEITPEYADYLRSRGISLEDYSPGSALAEPGGGFNRAAQQHAQRVADNIGGQVLARTVESEGQQAIMRGEAVPKGPDMKANSGRDIDTVLGMDPANMNRVVVFEPTMPSEEAYSQHLGRKPTESDWRNLEARRQKRQDQFDYYNEKLGKEGYPYHREEGGQRVIHSDSGLPIAGDMDTFDYRGLYGEPLPRAVQEEAYRQHLRNPGATGQNIASTVEHGAHMLWDISGLDNKIKGPDGKTDYQRALETKVGIIDQVRPGGDGGPLAVWSARSGLASEQVDSAYYTGPASED